MLVLGVAGGITSEIFFGWRIALGVALGATIAYLNFHWLKKVVAGLAELTIGSGTPASSRGVVHRFLLRYFLMALVAFVYYCFPREPLWIVCGLVFARSGDLVRDRLRGVCSVGTKDLKNQFLAFSS